MSLEPTERPGRGMIYRELAALGAEFGEVNGMACALRCGGTAEAEAERARTLAICDLSALPRLGFKGRAAITWAAGQGVTVSPENNMTVWQDDGACAARLADTEVLVLSDLAAGSGLCARLAAAWSPDPDPGAYPVPRADTNCWFLITGRHAATLFAKLCGVDLRPHKFAPGTVAQTSIARLNGIIIRADIVAADGGDTLAYHLLTDSAAALYMWQCLLDAMGEWGGVPVGLDAVRGLADRGGAG